jgi:hypothetical protein
MHKALAPLEKKKKRKGQERKRSERGCKGRERKWEGRRKVEREKKGREGKEDEK